MRQGSAWRILPFRLRQLTTDTDGREVTGGRDVLVDVLQFLLRIARDMLGQGRHVGAESAVGMMLDLRHDDLQGMTMPDRPTCHSAQASRKMRAA